MKTRGLDQITYNNIATNTGSIPIGTVISWWRPSGAFDVPTQFITCDGNLITDSDSLFNGYNSPNLTDKFVRSVDALGRIGLTGGSNIITLNHGHGSTSHSHGIAAHTHVFNSDTPSGTYEVGSGTDGSIRFTRISHYHDSWSLTHGGSTGGASIGVSSISLSNSNIPSYCGVLKILKIKNNLGFKIADMQSISLTNDSHSMYPVGSIIDWWVIDRDNPVYPSFFALCNGDIISNPNSIYYGFNSPSLSDKFIRGVPLSRIGEYSGSNTNDLSHTHSFDNHTHSANHGGDTAVKGGGNNPCWTTDIGTLFSIAPDGHNHTVTAGATDPGTGGSSSTTSSSGSGSLNNRPSYYTLVKLVKIL